MKNGIICDIDYTLSIPLDRDTYDFKNSLNDKLIHIFIALFQCR